MSVEIAQLKDVIYSHPEFSGFIASMAEVFELWQGEWLTRLQDLEMGFLPKNLVGEMGESLLIHYQDKPLLDAYSIYQHLLDYWQEVMQDDCYFITQEGWKAETRRVLETNKKGKAIDKGWVCDLIPKQLLVAKYFVAKQEEINQSEADLENIVSQRTELEEENSGDEGVLAELDKINKANVTNAIKELKADKLEFDINHQENEELKVLSGWLELYQEEAKLKKDIKAKVEVLDKLVYEYYPLLSETEIKTLVIEDKWMNKLKEAMRGEMDLISQSLTQRVKVLAQRYTLPLPQLTQKVNILESRVTAHLAKMGFSL